MILRIFHILPKAANTGALRRRGGVIVGLLALMALCAGTPASAQRVHFRDMGGRWSHYRHSGWHRYWGGPSIGFYYAPSPVFVVPGYGDPYYYTGPEFWYSSPSFGLSLNFGGGGYYGRPRYHRWEGVRRWHHSEWRGGGWHGGGHFYHDRYRR